MHTVPRIVFPYHEMKKGIVKSYVTVSVSSVATTKSWDVSRYAE